MPFRTFNTWLFDGDLNSPIPTKTVNILKYNSPITHTFVLKQFLKHGPLNHYLDQQFNNIGVRYLSKEDLFKFIKKCVHDFKITKRDIVYQPRYQKLILFEHLREKLPELKNDDLYLLCDLIEKSDEKEAIYESFGLEKPKKVKLNKAKKKVNEKISLKEFLKENFSAIKVD